MDFVFSIQRMVSECVATFLLSCLPTNSIFSKKELDRTSAPRILSTVKATQQVCGADGTLHKSLICSLHHPAPAQHSGRWSQSLVFNASADAFAAEAT